MRSFWEKNKKFFRMLFVGLVMTGILISLPTGFEDALIYQGTERAVATVVAVDNSAIISSGLIQSGEQTCVLSIGKGLFAGREITVLSIWKILVPCYLNGYSPVWVGIALTTFLAVVILYFVYGIEKRTLVASMGFLLGVLTTCVLGIVFTDLFKIHGAVMANSESLLYSGYENLDLTAIFMSSIFIGASGAMMDLAVDITAAVSEVVEKKPEIGWLEAAKSGMNVGRAAMGTMTTTLLLAYSGGCVALLMVFMAQGTPVNHILNYKYVAAEVLDTIAGSFGLVTVAPFTALVAGLILTKKSEN